MTIDLARAAEIQRNALADWVRAVAAGARTAELFDRDGVTACAVPACPNRSIVNSVTYTHGEGLVRLYDELRDFYERLGIEAWTVWVPDFDPGTVEALEGAGHTFDGKPTAMVLELDGWEPPPIGDLDWDRDGDPETFGRINDLAYGYTPETGYARAMSQPVDGYTIYRARADGETACVVGTLEHDRGDLGIYFVATVPEHRGKGLTSRLMAVALSEASERGLVTSSLQASAMGQPIYANLGYVGYFRLHLYERRGT
ncbi:MAG TPA: GNAT family N-acetyltransferase [Solirubrobacterales bacterium]|nr:GNAT family N-acetyltransferase [Solirubrobacterales bacterium]